jgi:hypothetical protein
MWGDKRRTRKMIIEVEDKDAELLITDSLNDALRNIPLERLCASIKATTKRRVGKWK